MNSENKQILTDYWEKINNKLNEYMSIDDELPQENVIKAMEHSLSAGGKRIRPVLVMEFYKMCGGKGDVLPIACAVEMIHTFSLIHDDLPCMDNDDFRRGKPSCHKAFGEAIALLAGDALATMPYQVITDEAIKGNISYESAAKVVNELATMVGIDGMIGGQVIDLENEGKQMTEGILVNLNSLKTGALISASCVIGCLLAGADKKKIDYARQYAASIGQAFQIIDDILDVTSSFEKLGKPINSDESNNKTTYVTLFGLEKSKEIAMRLTEHALKMLGNFENTAFLVDLTKMLLDREN